MDENIFSDTMSVTYFRIRDAKIVQTYHSFSKRIGQLQKEDKDFVLLKRIFNFVSRDITIFHNHFINSVEFIKHIRQSKHYNYY